MLGFFKKKKKAEPEATIIWEETLHPDVNDMPVEEVEEDDDWLPYGWLYEHSDFTDRISAEWKVFLNRLIESRNASPIEQYGALKSLVLYLEDARALCRQNGEYFERWFNGIIANQEYIYTKKAELANLEANMDAKIKEYEDGLEHERLWKEFAESVTNEMLLEQIELHEEILQTDLYKLYDHPCAKEVLKEKLYFMDAEGLIERTKSGRTYLLKIKNRQGF